MYPGPEDPDLGVFVQQLERELARRGHEIERAVLDRRAGGKRRYLRLGRETRSRGAALPTRRRLRALPRPDRTPRPRSPRGRRSSSRPTAGTSATSAPSRGSARRRASSCRRAARRRRRLRLPSPRARDEGSRGAREGRGRRLRRRSRALPRRARARDGADRRSSASASLTSGRTSSGWPTHSSDWARDARRSSATGRSAASSRAGRA